MANFHNFSTRKKNKLLKAYGPKQLMDPDDDMSIDYAQPLNATDQAGIKEADRLYKTVVGRCFIHPLNSQLYEIMHLY
jgi:hypothetical protein